jgi:hypothetical protein
MVFHKEYIAQRTQALERLLTMHVENPAVCCLPPSLTRAKHYQNRHVTYSEEEKCITDQRGNYEETMTPRAPHLVGKRDWYTPHLFHVKSTEVVSPHWVVPCSVSSGGYWVGLSPLMDLP